MDAVKVVTELLLRGEVVGEAGLVVDRKELEGVLKSLRKLSKARRGTEAFVSYSNGHMKIQSRTVSIAIAASGTFSYKIAVNSEILARLGDVLPKNPTITVKTDVNLLLFDTFSISGRIVETPPDINGPISKLIRQTRPKK